MLSTVASTFSHVKYFLIIVNVSHLLWINGSNPRNWSILRGSLLVLSQPWHWRGLQWKTFFSILLSFPKFVLFINIIFCYLMTPLYSTYTPLSMLIFRNWARVAVVFLVLSILSTPIGKPRTALCDFQLLLGYPRLIFTTWKFFHIIIKLNSNT